jgi:RNA recognition motif. (a.k.a. RRM, RBD, or RNP domain)
MSSLFSGIFTTQGGLKSGLFATDSAFAAAAPAPAAAPCPAAALQQHGQPVLLAESNKKKKSKASNSADSRAREPRHPDGDGGRLVAGIVAGAAAQAAADAHKAPKTVVSIASSPLDTSISSTRSKRQRQQQQQHDAVSLAGNGQRQKQTVKQLQEQQQQQQQKQQQIHHRQQHSSKRQRPQSRGGDDAAVGTSAAAGSAAGDDLLPAEAAAATAEAVNNTADTGVATDKLDRTVFVGNLPVDVRRKALLRHFASFGAIESVRLRSVPLDLEARKRMPRRAAVIKGVVAADRGGAKAYIVFADAAAATSALCANMTEVSETD